MKQKIKNILASARMTASFADAIEILGIIEVLELATRSMTLAIPNGALVEIDPTHERPHSSVLFERGPTRYL